MQAAARKVLDENKRLRALLKNRGMSDAEIDAFMAAEGDDLSEESGTPPSQKLTKMLHSRKPCCPDNEDICSPPSAGSSGQSAILQLDTKPQIQLPPPHVVHQPNSRQLAPLPMSNSSISPRTALPLSATMAISSAPLQMSSNYHPTLGSHHSGPPSHNTAAYSAYPYNSQYESHWQPPPPPASYDSAGRGRPMQTYANDARSRGDATTTIRSMRIDQGPDLETDLGYAPVTDNNVDNIIAMDVMQKYSNQPHGMWR
jgi:hypothetical protein